MRYLFFDIECADGYRAICEFGYVITDEKFNVLFQRNLLVDPEHKFNLTDRPNQDNLILTYEESYYRKFYPFDDKDVYGFIKNLMTQKDLIIFGHSVKNDINFLFKDCKRYNLGLFDFIAYDIQKMLPAFRRDNPNFTSLEKAFENYVPREIAKNLKEHRAVDDAMKTMLVFKEMISRLEFSVDEFIETCPNSKVDAVAYFNKLNETKKKNREKAIKDNHRFQGKQLWKNLVEEQKQSFDKSVDKENVIAISYNMREHPKELKSLIKYIKDNGYFGSNSIKDSGCLIVYDEENKNEIELSFKGSFKDKILTYKEFISQ